MGWKEFEEMLDRNLRGAGFWVDIALVAFLFAMLVLGLAL